MDQTYYYSIASGSQGNCSLLVGGNTRILIDMGVSVRRLTAALARVGLTPDLLDAVLLTHEHTDHIKGLATFAKRFDTPIYASFGTAAAVTDRIPALAALLRPFSGGDRFAVGRVLVRTFPTPHDAAESVGFAVEGDGLSFGFATDLGFMPDLVKDQLLGRRTVVLESNHDALMLQTGPYPWPLKQRVAGPRGHLSNRDCAACAAELAAAGTQTLILAHLSEHNNTPLTAFRETQAALRAAGQDCALFVAPKAEMEHPLDLQPQNTPCLASV